MAPVFWDTHGIQFADYMKKDQAIIKKYYIILLDWSDDETKRERPYVMKKDRFIKTMHQSISW